MNEEKFNLKYSIMAKLFSEMDYLQHDLSERDKIEEESGKVKASLEEELARCKAEMQRITEELQHEVQTWKRTVEKLQQSMNQINFITNSVQTTAGCDSDKP